MNISLIWPVARREGESVERAKEEQVGGWRREEDLDSQAPAQLVTYTVARFSLSLSLSLDYIAGVLWGLYFLTVIHHIPPIIRALENPLASSDGNFFSFSATKRTAVQSAGAIFVSPKVSGIPMSLGQLCR